MVDPYPVPPGSSGFPVWGNFALLSQVPTTLPSTLQLWEADIVLLLLLLYGGEARQLNMKLLRSVDRAVLGAPIELD